MRVTDLHRGNVISLGSGQRMTQTHAVKKGRRNRYYISTSLITGSCSALSKAKRRAETRADLPSNKVRELVRSIVETVEIQDENIVISLKQKDVASVPSGNVVNAPVIEELGTFELCVEAKLRRAGKGIRLVVDGRIAEKPDRQMAALMRDRMQHVWRS